MALEDTYLLRMNNAVAAQRTSGKAYPLGGGKPDHCPEMAGLSARAMDIPLGIRRRGRTIYFWVESPLTQKQPTGAQQRRSTQAQPFLITEEDQEEPGEMLKEGAQPDREGVSGSPGLR